MTVVLIVFFSILLVSFITGIIITAYEEKKSSEIVVVAEQQIPAEIEKVIVEEKENEEKLSLEKTLVMKPVEVSNLEKTMYYEQPVIIESYDLDEEII